MTSSNIMKNLHLLTAALCLTLGAAITLALTIGPHPWTYAAVAATVLVLAWFVNWARSAMLPIMKLRDRITGGREGDSVDVGLPPDYEEIAREVETSRLALRAMLRTCYSLVAAVNDAESVSVKIRRDVFAKMGELEESVTGLRGALVTLRTLRPAEPAAAWGSGPGDAVESGPEGASGQVSDLLDDISGSLEDMTAVLRDVRHDAKELLSSAGETSYSVSRLDSFLQDMVRSGKDLESSTDTANRVALEAIKVIEEMEKENRATIASVKKAAKSAGTLGMWSQEIGKIIEVIKDIADETNLLALNVAIIASQSGEHGKAFGVVAEEIRGLAERTSSSTKEISDLITTVQTSVANVVVEMKESVERVERGEVLVGSAGKVIDKISDSFEMARNIAHEIASNTSEHRMDSNHVVRSFQNVAEIARRLDASNSERGAGSRRGATAAQTLKVLNRVMVPAGSPRVPAANYAAAYPAGGPGIVAGCAGAVTSGSDSIELIDRGIKLLDAVDEYVGSVRDGLGVYFDALANTATLIRAVARQLNLPHDAGEFKRCWEEFEHDDEEKRSCPEYGQADWRCFLAEDIDRSLCGDRDHSPAGCYACPVFQDNMDTLLPESECQRDG
ncbi:MAG: methyl-accepting chemotaxis protein [bacterium]